MRRAAIGLVWLAACGSDDGASEVDDSSATTEVSTAVEDTSIDSALEVETVDPWAAVDQAARTAMVSDGIVDAGLVVYDADDHIVFEHMYGDFAPDRRLAVASASKLVAGLVLFELIARGELALDDTTATALGWTGDGADITLRHLLSFTSGLARTAVCTALPGRTLAECVATIHDAAIVALPGARFDYGSTHLHVAARMAEVAHEASWNDIFREVLADPLGLPADVLFYTAPRQGTGTTNPLVAGGLRASMRDYAPMLAVLFHRGGGLGIGEAALFDAQAVEPYPTATIGYSPYVEAGQPYHYGLASWLECPAPVTSACPVIASPGAFGFTPWVDREHGYYAIFAMEDFAADEGVAASSVRVSYAVRPAILAALAR